MIPLRREEIAAGAAVRVEKLPMWLGPSTSKGVYWHIPRSAMNFGDRISVRMWCGVHMNYRFIPSREPTEGEKCGTCFGRYEGAEGLDGLIFTPRDDFAPPKLCPGWPENGHRGLCALCSEFVRYWGASVQRHAPGPGFADRCRPCPDHGWRNVSLRHERLICYAWCGGEFGRCEFDCGPF